MKKIALVVLGTLTACAAPQTVMRPVQVEVPVAVSCVPPVVDHPVWPLNDLPDNAGFYQMTRALLAENELREAYEIKLRAALDSCR